MDIRKTDMITWSIMLVFILLAIGEDAIYSKFNLNSAPNQNYLRTDGLNWNQIPGGTKFEGDNAAELFIPKFVANQVIASSTVRTKVLEFFPPVTPQEESALRDVTDATNTSLIFSKEDNEQLSLHYLEKGKSYKIRGVSPSIIDPTQSIRITLNGLTQAIKQVRKREPK